MTVARKSSEYKSGLMDVREVAPNWQANMQFSLERGMNVMN
jgi:hypothetical protein